MNRKDTIRDGLTAAWSAAAHPLMRDYFVCGDGRLAAEEVAEVVEAALVEWEDAHYGVGGEGDFFQAFGAGAGSLWTSDASSAGAFGYKHAAGLARLLGGVVVDLRGESGGTE